MIIDQLAHADTYSGLCPPLPQALEFLRSTDCTTLPLGRHTLDGDRLFALVQEYTTRPVEQGAWEAHRKYCDVQLVAAGVERMGFAPLGQMQVKQTYDAGRDVAFFTGPGNFITVRGDLFVIFFPHDVHMPAIAVGQCGPVRKIVLKAAVHR